MSHSTFQLMRESRELGTGNRDSKAEERQKVKAEI
jgi:hypothetical protein